MKALAAIQQMLRGEPVEGFRMQLPPPVAKLIGFVPVTIGPGEAVFRLEVRREVHSNPMGTVHGGILCDIADAAMGMSCGSLLDEGESFTTLELRMNFLRPFWEGTIEARAKAAHQGKSMVYLECEVISLPEEKLIAKSSSTCLILRGEQARGR